MARSLVRPPVRALAAAALLLSALGAETETAAAQSAKDLGAAMANAAAKAAETATPVATTGPALFWRLLDAPGLRGVMRLSDDVAAGKARYGFFAFNLRDRGVFEGVYNVKADGKGAVGIFWPDGRLNQGGVSGYLDLRAAPNGGGAGRVTFVDAEPVEGLRAR